MSRQASLYLVSNGPTPPPGRELAEAQVYPFLRAVPIRRFYALVSSYVCLCYTNTFMVSLFSIILIEFVYFFKSVYISKISL